MSKEKVARKYPVGIRITRIVLKSIAFLLLFVLFIFLILLTPPAQRFLTSKVQHYLENKLHTTVKIGRISFGLSGKIGLHDVFIEDQTKDTLVSGESIRARLNYTKLFSNEISVRYVELENVTAKIKRVLPDTVFNFKFIADAFMSKSPKEKVDTSTSTPMKLDIDVVELSNVTVVYNDVVTGNDLRAHVGQFDVHIDTLDPSMQHFVIPVIVLKNTDVAFKQSKPLVTPATIVSANSATSAAPMNIQLGKIDLQTVSIDFGSNVSAMYANAKIGTFSIRKKKMDLARNDFELDNITLADSKIIARLGKTAPPAKAKKSVKDTIAKAPLTAFNVLVQKLSLNNNEIQFDNDNSPVLNNGLDYGHIAATNVALEAEDLKMSADSTAISIKKSSIDEKSGLKIEQMQGDILYASQQAYVKNLYLKTPGSEIRKSVVVTYPSIDALTKDISHVNVQLDVAQTTLQVKDILLFAPQLRGNPAMRNSNAVWKVNVQGSGNMNQFNVASLQFAGLNNTQVDARGTLTGLTNLKNAGANFYINRVHTTQTDIALFSGSRLSNAQMDLPEDFTLSGQVSGNSGLLHTALNLQTSDGNMTLNGKFSGFSTPATLRYDGTLKTFAVQVGKIMRQPDQIGALTATFTFNGKGGTPATVHTKFTAIVPSIVYNKYDYQNININGSLDKTDFAIESSIKDPNADAHIDIAGNFSDHPAFSIDGMIDSIKAMPLHLTTEPLMVRAKITGKVSDLKGDVITSDVLVTEALLVSGETRLPIDTMQLKSGENDTSNYVYFNSSLASASIVGQYRLADLGTIIQNSIQPYFSTASATTASTTNTNTAIAQPYNFRIKANAIYHPILATLVPGLTEMKELQLNGAFSNTGGMNFALLLPSITYQGTAITGVKATANTGANGLVMVANIARVQSGNSFDVYDARLDATALHNNIDFAFSIDDANAHKKYAFAGLIKQPATGTYALSFKPEGLLLNYEKWTVTADNSITISPDNVIAKDFTLENGRQGLSINSPDDRGQQVLNVEFANFRLATITGFVKADSVLADGLINGNIKASNFLKQPSFAGDLTINDLSLKNDTVGNVAIHATTSGLNKYNLETTITGKGNDVALGGWIENSASGMNLNLDLDVRALQLSTIEGAMAGAIRDASGTIRGKVAVRGTATKPSINGSLGFDKTNFVLVMLGSKFSLDNQQIAVTNEGLTFNNFTINDSTGNALSLNGNILTNNFVNYQFALKLTARNFQLLNSSKKDNPVYYGRMNISTDLSITGTELKPVVDGRITVNDGTALTFVVPQSEQGIEERDGIVEFVDMRNPASDTLFKTYDSLNKSPVLGMDVALNIEIRKEAVFNIVVDAANGDFLNAQGEAQLTAGIDPSGKITMTGNYTLEKGAYQLSFNFLQRKFEINKGSTITWTGEPTSAKLDINATYVANTSPMDLVQDQVEGSAAAIKNTYLQKLPFELRLNLTGELMKPQVAFDIVLPEDKNYGVSNDVVTTVQYKLTQLRADQGETNKQVFSLLLLNRFVGEDPFHSAGGGGGFSAGTYVRQSASKLLTEQLNALAAGLVNGVDINFDVASTEDYTTGSMRNRTDLNLNVSKKLLNDRLKITVGSDFELEGPQNSNQQSNNIAGNVAVDYQLSKNGRYMIRFFRKNDYEGVIDGYVIENGLSFIISVDYNKFRQLFHTRKQRVTKDGSENKEKVTAR